MQYFVKFIFSIATLFRAKIFYVDYYFYICNFIIKKIIKIEYSFVRYIKQVF